MLVLVMQVMRRFKDPASAQTKNLEQQLRIDMEDIDQVRIKELRQTLLSGENDEGSFNYRLSGFPPHQQIIRYGDQGQTILLENVNSLRFTGYDSKGYFLSDAPTSTELETMTKIQVDVAIHEPQENPSLFVNDGIHGVDLDGDPANGVAPVKSRQFGLILPKN